MAEPDPSEALRACDASGQLNSSGAALCSACSKATGVPQTPTLPFEDPRQLLGRIVNGKYEVLSILGEGGMGVVYKVRHLILQHKNTFALKILHPRLCAQVDFQTRFLREVEIAMELTHENIIQIRDFGLTEQNLLFYTMDFFSGESLKSLLERERVIAPTRVIRIAKQILLALSEAHKSGIIHRDLKPDNVLIERIDEQNDSVRILDFGIAKVLVGDSEMEEKSLTQGSVIGTPRYMSPEQASGESIDARSDLYAFGCMLYEMLTGHPPFTGLTSRSILVAHLTVPPPPFEKLKTGLNIPLALEKLVFFLLSKSQENRPDSAEAVIDLLEGRKVSTPRAVETKPTQQKKPRWFLPAGALAFTLLAFGIFTWPTSRRHGQAEATTECKLRCNVCGAVYLKGAKVGGMCHGEPLLEQE